MSRKIKYYPHENNMVFALEAVNKKTVSGI
jgi:hypothetical protein